MPTEHANADAHSDATGHAQAALTAEQEEALYEARKRATMGLYDAERDYARTVAKVAYDFHNDLKGAGIDPAQYPAPSSRLGYYAPQQPANADTRAQAAAA